MVIWALRLNHSRACHGPSSTSITARKVAHGDQPEFFCTGAGSQESFIFSVGESFGDKAVRINLEASAGYVPCSWKEPDFSRKK